MLCPSGRHRMVHRRNYWHLEVSGGGDLFLDPRCARRRLKGGSVAAVSEDPGDPLLPAQTMN